MDPAVTMLVITSGLYALAIGYVFYPYGEKPKPELEKFQKDITDFAKPEDKTKKETSKKKKRSNKKK